MDKSLKYVTHGQSTAKPTVIFPAAGHRRPFTGNKLHSSASNEHKVITWKWNGWGQWPYESPVQRPNHYTTHQVT